MRDRRRVAGLARHPREATKVGRHPLAHESKLSLFVITSTTKPGAILSDYCTYSSSTAATATTTVRSLRTTVRSCAFIFRVVGWVITGREVSAGLDRRYIDIFFLLARLVGYTFHKPCFRLFSS